MVKEKATITLDRRKAEEARALVGAESTSAVVDVALDTGPSPSRLARHAPDRRESWASGPCR